MSYLKKFKEQLPSKQKFYSYLASNTISGKEYKHILKVWNRFDKKKKMRDYHHSYLKCNVLLLANVFGKFRSNSLKNNGLCPIHYLSVTALSWDAMLNMTKVNLKLMPGHEMYILFEKSSGGENSYF